MNTANAITLAVLASLTPTVTCLIGINLSRQDARDVRSEIGDLRKEMHAGFARADEHLGQFYAITGKLEGRVDEISKR